MQFSEFSKYLSKLENTSKRLEITDILADLISNLDQEELDLALYLSLGTLKPPFDSERFNIAEKLMIKAIANSLEISTEQVQKKYSETGDLGDSYLNIATRTPNSSINIVQTYEKLLKIAKYEGNGSQDNKISDISKLLKELDELSSKYIIRIILGTTRLGFTELTILDALAQLVEKDKTKSKAIKKQLEDTYMKHPDIGLIAKIVKNEGINSLDEINLETGIPIFPQKCQRVKSAEEAIEKMSEVWAEYKFDGTRVQLHMDKNKKLSKTTLQNSLFDDKENKIYIKTFTRNLEETTHQFPELIQAATKYINAESAILDGEAIGYDPKTKKFLPFQDIMQRKRKHDIKEAASEIPVKYFVFDILYLNGESLLKKPLIERRNILKQTIIENDVITIDEHLQTDNAETLQEYFETAKDNGLEGLVIKKINSTYKAGAREFTWVKLKVADQKLLDDTVDCVVLGYYHGRGVRADFGIGGFLAGIYDKNKDEFVTITKVGTGLSDQDWKDLKEMCDKHKISEAPSNVKMDKIYTPDVFVKPNIIVELGADEITKSSTHTAGYALRFPRLIKFRKDKSPNDTTDISEIESLNKMQKRASI